MGYKTSEWTYFSLEIFLLPGMSLSLCPPKGHWKNKGYFSGASPDVGLSAVPSSVLLNVVCVVVRL